MTDWKTLPAVYQHCVDIYTGMEEVAKEDPDGRMVYQGFLTKLFTKKNLSVPYYTAVMNHLKRMDCVRQLSRGAGSQPSRWVLVQPPTESLFETSPALKKTSADEILSQRIRDQQTLINELANRLEIVEAKLSA